VPREVRLAQKFTGHEDQVGLLAPENLFGLPRLRDQSHGSRGDLRVAPNTDDAMTRSEEQLRVGTETREAGTARLRKHVVTENVSRFIEQRLKTAHRFGNRLSVPTDLHNGGRILDEIVQWQEREHCLRNTRRGSAIDAYKFTGECRSRKVGIHDGDLIAMSNPDQQNKSAGDQKSTAMKAIQQ